MRNSIKQCSVSAPWKRNHPSRHAGQMKGPNRTTGQTQNTSEQLDYNQSEIQYFFIFGGEMWLKDFYTELTVLLLLVYILVLIVNIMVFMAVVLETKLHTPMYIYLSSLSITDIIIPTSVLPKMISVCLFNDFAISFSGCFLQQIIYLSFQSIEALLLAVMSYDRYVAICNPLRYNSIITPKICALLTVFAWIAGIAWAIPITVYASTLPYCGKRIMFWFCDFPPVIALSCLDTTFLLFIALFIALLIIITTAFSIVWTYSKIISAIFKITSVDGRKKTFSTCSSHLTIVVIFYFAHMCVYISSTAKNVHPSVIILVSIFNCVLTPFANPIIYGFSNKELKTAILRHFRINQVLMLFSQKHAL